MGWVDGLAKGFGEGEAEGGEGTVAVGLGPVELLGEGAVDVEAGAGEGGEGPPVAPVESEEAAGFSGGGARDRGLLDEGDGGPLLGEEVGGADADDTAAADHNSFPLLLLRHRRCDDRITVAVEILEASNLNWRWVGKEKW